MNRVFVIVACLLAGPVNAQDASRGAALYADLCAVCHGPDARGGGPMAEVLTVPPPDLTLIAARQGGFPRVATARLIDGRAAVLGHGGEMPLFGWVFGEASVVLETTDGQPFLTAPEVVDLVAYLEAIQR